VGIGGPVDNHGGYGRCLQISGIEAALELESSSGYSYVAQNGVDLQIRNVANGDYAVLHQQRTERMRIDSAHRQLPDTVSLLLQVPLAQVRYCWTITPQYQHLRT
jgi:hypothetical protein